MHRRDARPLTQSGTDPRSGTQTWGAAALEAAHPTIPSAGCGSSEAEHRLYAALFESYNQFVRPVKNVSDPVIIQFEVSMSQLVKVVSTCPDGAPAAKGGPAPRPTPLSFLG